MRQIKPSVHIVLNVGTLSDQEIGALGANVAKSAPSSALFAQNPSIQTSVSDIGAENVVLAGFVAAIVKTEADLVTLKGQRDDSRGRLEKAVLGLRGLVESKATKVTDANAVGFNARLGRTPTSPLIAPDTVTVILGKKHGQFTASAKTSLKHTRFGAQISADPTNAANWQDLPGTGKRRIIKGHVSATVLWVRFRALRGSAQSDWCTPVSVTVP